MKLDLPDIEALFKDLEQYSPTLQVTDHNKNGQTGWYKIEIYLSDNEEPHIEIIINI